MLKDSLVCSVSAIRVKLQKYWIKSQYVNKTLLYGRGAPAIAREVQKAGVDITADEAQEFIDSFMLKFPDVAKLIATTHSLVESRGWVETLWGRRAFYPSVSGLANEYKLRAAQNRKAFNFLIQGYVGDLLRKALISFYDYRKQYGNDILRVILTVHDSIMAEVPIKYVEHVTNKVFPYCMTKAAVCPRLPFEIGIDVDVSLRWDEQMYFDDMIALGLSEEFAKTYCKTGSDGEVLTR